ncbi:MAG: phosphatase PAP2 family protein [Clostridiales bacterium]|nr:phosphatase PAP2 family protein [Clostridiales bacterium]
MEQKIILWLQSLSNEFLDVFFQGVSYIASWIGAICVFLVILIFVNKKYGVIFGSGFLATIGINFLLKVIIKRPRPYIANPQIINKLTTIGHSFPSGHSVSAIFIVLAVLYLLHILNKHGKFNLFNKKWFKILTYLIAILFILLTAISRMYLGQHYISDIIGGLIVGTFGFMVSAFVYKKFFNGKKNNN